MGHGSAFAQSHRSMCCCDDSALRTLRVDTPVKVQVLVTVLACVCVDGICLWIQRAYRLFLLCTKQTACCVQHTCMLQLSFNGACTYHVRGGNAAPASACNGFIRCCTWFDFAKRRHMFQQFKSCAGQIVSVALITPCTCFFP